jgi:hypothetical protein
MANIVRKGKTNRHEKITQVLLSGKPVTVDEIHSVFKGTDQEKVLYRLSTNIYNIRLDGGIIKVIKDKRKVVAYQLVNHTEFNADGRYVGKQVATVKPVQPVAPVQPVQPVKPVKPVEQEETV